MENLLIEIYLFVCHVYDTSSATCYQRLSNNLDPEFTDQEFITIWFFAHLEGCFEKKRMHRLILKYWREWFPRLPSYQTFVLRLNRLSRLYPFLERQQADGISLLFSTPDFCACPLFDRHAKSLANSRDAKSFIYVPCFQNG
jgi:hypothetical protein